MRTSLQLLRLAVGDPQFQPEERIDSIQTRHFDLYKARLPSPAFRGFPPDWVFAILRKSVPPNDRQMQESVEQEAHSLYGSYFKQRPVVLISDDPNMHLGNEFQLRAEMVFCLDAPDLPRQDDLSALPRNAPFVLAVRNKLQSEQIRDFFSPYQKKDPVNGWRFFGRKDELRQLMNLKSSYAIVGGRRLGKTSLLQEAKRLLEEAGQTVYLIDVQTFQSAKEVQDALVRTIYPKEIYYSRHKILAETLLDNILKRVTSRNEMTTLLFDELGLVITKMPKEDWSFIGVLRKFSQQGRLRVVFTSFQELFLQQQKDFYGPLVNFVEPIRLGLFSESEAEDFIFGPLEFWKPLDDKDRKSLLRLVTSQVGRHPLCLQHFCSTLFDQVTAKQESVLATARRLIQREEDFFDCFHSVVDEIFFKMNSPTLMYLFLQRCWEADRNRGEVGNAVLDDDWIEEALQAAGYEAPLLSRLNLLEGLQIHGLCVPEPRNRHQQTIAVPVVYTYLKREKSVERWLPKLIKAIPEDPLQYGLKARTVVPASIGGNLT